MEEREREGGGHCGGGREGGNGGREEMEEGREREVERGRDMWGENTTTSPLVPGPAGIALMSCCRVWLALFVTHSYKWRP